MTTDTAGSYLSPVGKGGVLAGAPSALQVRVKRALERYEDATFYGNAVTKVEAINDLLDELRRIAGRPSHFRLMPGEHWSSWFASQEEYDEYTTRMEQAEERKS